MRKRILSIILSLTMICTIVPTTALAVSNKDDIATNVTSGTVYFGNRADGATPALYRVVARDSGTITLFYDGANIADERMAYDASLQNWENSAICQWLNGDDFLNNTSVLTTAEKSAIKAQYSTIQDSVYIPPVETGVYTPADPVTPNQSIVLPSVEEVQDGGTWGLDTAARTVGEAWRLRTPGYSDGTNHNAAFVGDNGIVHDIGDGIGNKGDNRPAFKLNLSSILFTSAAVDGKSNTAGATLLPMQTVGGEQKLTILDTTNLNTGAVTATGTDINSGTIIKVSTAGATANKSLSAIITDSTGETVKFYGKIADIDDSGNVTNVDLALPVTLDTDNVLKIFAEQINGDYLTDYASGTVDISVTAPDITIPILTKGTTSRISDSDATVKFTSNEAGTYFYNIDSVVTDTSAGGTTCDTSEQTITLSSLTAGIHDIYIVVKDAAGNVSDNTFNIPISAFVASMTDEEKVAAAKASIEAALSNLSVSNSATADDIFIIAQNATLYDVAVEWDSTSGFSKTNATSSVSGFIIGTLNLSLNSATATVSLNKTITKLSGGGSSGSSYDYYTIVVAQAEGGTISPTTVNVREYLDKTFTITPNVGYIVKDVLVDGKSVGEVKEYTFKNVTSRHKITAVFEMSNQNNPNTGMWVNPFVDVKTNDWFYEKVALVHELGLMNGTSATTFEPNADTTRGMIVTVFYNIAGKPEIVANGDEWYVKSRAWAMENGISDGTNMDNKITREQLVTMLWRNAGEPKLMDYTGLTSFIDTNEISSYAQLAFAWAHQQGIICGKGNGHLDPRGSATRAEVATMIINYLNVMEH